MPVSLFWFAWYVPLVMQSEYSEKSHHDTSLRTSGGETFWVAPTLAGIPFGFATITIFYTFLT